MTMPPKVKRSRGFHCQGGKDCHTNTNPRVILRPLMADPSGQYRSHFTSEPPTASLFNKPEFSDIKLRVGSDFYYAHRVVLCSASEVFAKMLSKDWGDCKNNELVIHEEGECAKVFDRFLYFFYSGSIVISESYVIPLFTLADKYDVKPVHEECIKIIEKGLKVYVVESNANKASISGLACVPGQDSNLKYSHSSTSSSASSDDSSSSDAFDSDDSTTQDNPAPFPEPPPSAAPMSPTKTSRTLSLIGSETFPVWLVIKMLKMWHNPRISTAARHNLEARLGNQITQENYSTWHTLEKELIVSMLGDANFCYGEYVLFKAAKAWLEHEGSQDQDLISHVLSHIRYPLLLPEQLYEVEKEPLIQRCAPVTKLLQEAMRYQLFQHCCSEDDRNKWLGIQFQARKPRIA